MDWFTDIMYIILADKGMWILFSIINTLYLDCGVEQPIFSATKVGGLTQRLEWLLAGNMYWHRKFSGGQWPDVEIMYVYDVLSIDVGNIMFELEDINALGGSLHHDTDYGLNDGKCGCHHNHWEQVGAERVCIPEWRIEVDNRCSNDNSYWH